MYSKHEREKERKYGDRCVHIEKGTCNGLLFSTTGGMSPQATMFLKRVATILAAETSQDKSLIMANDVDEEDDEVDDEVQNVEEEVSEE